MSVQEDSLEPVVKALEWKALGKFVEISETPFGEYTVEYYEESDGCGWEAVYDETGTLGYFPKEAEAKAAAQADYEQRIRSAIEPAGIKITDEMVERGLTQYSEGGCMGLDQRERREVVESILIAALEVK